MSYTHPLLPSITVYKRGEAGTEAPFITFSTTDPDGWRLDGNYGNTFHVDSDTPNGWAFSLSGENVTFTIPANAQFLNSRTGGGAGQLYYGLDENHTSPVDAQYVLTFIQGGVHRRYEFSVRNVRPVAAFEVEVDGDLVTVDATASSDEDGSIVAYHWDWDGNGTEDQTTSSATPTHTYTAEGDYEIRLQVQDDGTGRSLFVTQNVRIEFGIVGQYVDAGGAVYTAVTEGTDILVYRFKGGTSSRETLTSISNARNPSIFKIDGIFYLAYSERSTGNAVILRSRDGAFNFSMPATIWDSSYKNATVSPLIYGGAISVATKDGEVWFRRSLDITSWSDAPVQIEALADAKVAHVYQRFVSGSSELLATDGLKLVSSRDGGKTWEAI